MNSTCLKRFCMKHRLLFITLIIIMFHGLFLPVMVRGETVREIFHGREDAARVLENLRYTDIAGSGAESAILKSGAMGILKGFGSRFFRPGSYLTKEEAIALVYRMAGREEEAQMEGERLNLMRRRENRKTSAVAIWHDGFLQLAANDGLISSEDLQDALRADQDSLGDGDFRRNLPVLRQEFAYWLAKALELEPVYVQEAVFNSYNDWNTADPEKIPWIEAVLSEGIMSNDGNGYFRPNRFVDRMQAALVVNNSLDAIARFRGLRREFGTVEEVSALEKKNAGRSIIQNTYQIRNSDGSLHEIVADDTRDIIVIKNGVAGNRQVLEKGDRIEYIADTSYDGASGEVVCVEVISSVDDTRYMAVKLIEIDRQQRIAKVKEYFELDFPHFRPGDSIGFEMPSGKSEALYRYKEGINDDIKAGVSLIITIRNGIITEIKKMEFPFAPVPESIVGGIVEDNNPSLGYITLYNEDGTGVSPENLERMVLFRTFNYPSGKSVEVFKNHAPAAPEDIVPGDTVFIRLDSEGFIESLSAADNYMIRRGRIIARTESSITVKYENGSQQILEITGDVVVTSEGVVAGGDALTEGDYVELMVNVTDKGTTLRRISINNGNKLITGLYKGVLSDVDFFTRSIMLYNMERLDGGNWNRVEHKGVATVRISENCSFYAGGKELSLQNISPLYRGNRVYMAVKTGHGGVEFVEALLFENGGPETVLTDEILFASSGGVVRLSAGYPEVYCVPGTIIVNRGRLVSPGSIGRGETVNLVANRDPVTGRYNASLVSLVESTGLGNLEIYRGRISRIEENRSFTIESFSRLGETGWTYSNTPKTFNILHETRILNEEGVGNIRNFKGYGDDSSIGRTVYVVADGISAKLISNIPYGAFLTRGTIRGIEDGTVYLGNVRNYDRQHLIWKESNDIRFSMEPNTIIIKNGKVITTRELAPGDSVTLLRGNDSAEEAYIVITQ